MEWVWCVSAKNVTMGAYKTVQDADRSVRHTPGFHQWLKCSEAYSEALFQDNNANYFIVTIVQVKCFSDTGPMW